MINTFNMNVEKANELVNKVWNYEFGNPHKNFLEGWASNKKAYLAQMFGGELILEKEIVIEQSISAMHSQLNNFRWSLMNLVEKQVWYEESMWYELRDLITVDSLYNNKIDDNYSFGEKRKFNKGEKLTRGFRKLFKDTEQVEKLQIEYSQLMNTKKLTGKLCLSIHPMDFLTMSHTSSWGSCFDVFNDGEYKSGALEFMFARNTICAYLTTKDMEVAGETWNDKKWRCIISVEPDDYIVTGKNYPYQSCELTQSAYEWVRELIGKEEFPKFEDTVSLEDVEDYEIEMEFGYNDARYSEEYFFVGRHEERRNKFLLVEYDGIICSNCGVHGNDYGDENVVCECCDDSFYCECCEDRLGGDSHVAHNRWGDIITVCDYCLDEYYIYCDSCNEYHYYEDTTTTEDGYTYCEDCAEEEAFFCDRCEGWFRNIDKNLHKGQNLCCGCHSDVLDEEEEKEKEDKE